MIKQSITSRPAWACAVFLSLGLILGSAANAADGRNSRTSFEREQERLDHEERGLHKSFEADKKALNNRCEHDERVLRDTYRKAQHRLERELNALHDRCRDQRRALERRYENNKRALNDRREALRREHHRDGRDLKHPIPPPAPRRDDHLEPPHGKNSKGLPPGLERHEEKSGGKLPPGLQKQLDQKGQLPPGLEKR